MKFEICSEYDGWTITVADSFGKRGKVFTWNHNDVEDGVGGEKIFAKILVELGYDVEVEDYY